MQIQSGTASVILGDTNVIAGSGVNWQDATINSLFVVPGVGAVLYTIASVVAPGVSPSGFWEVNLSAPYQGTTNATASYAIAKDFMPVWGFPILNAGDVETALLFNRAFALLEQGFPSPSPQPVLTLVALTNIAALKAIDTPALTLGTVYLVYDSSTGSTSAWILLSGTASDDVTNGVALPDDYDGSTNQRYWGRTTF